MDADGVGVVEGGAVVDEELDNGAEVGGAEEGVEEGG